MSDILDHQQQKTFPIRKILKYYFIAAFFSFVAFYIAMIFDDRKLIEKYWNQHAHGYIIGWLLWDIIFIVICSIWYWLLVGIVYIIFRFKNWMNN